MFIMRSLGVGLQVCNNVGLGCRIATRRWLTTQTSDVAYIGTFGGTLKLLRRVSLCSATLSVTSLPMMMILHGTVPTLPQLVVIGTAVTASLGSTIFLKVMSYPYVTKFEEIHKYGKEDVTFEDRKFAAYRISMLGTEYPTEVVLKDIEHVKVTEHPFASFKANGDNFFIFHKMVSEGQLQRYLLNVQEGKDTVSTLDKV